MKKRWLSLVLVFAMLAIFAPTVTFASTAASGTCGDNLTWELDDDGVLTISGTGDMDDYTATTPPWYKESITSVILKDGVTSIGYRAFYCCKKYRTA